MSRIEKDILGARELKEETLYGINTARAVENFALGHKKMNRELIRSIVIVKKAAAAHGEFELNVFMPLIADSLLESLELMTSTIQLFRENVSSHCRQMSKIVKNT